MLRKLLPLVLFASVARADSSVPAPRGGGILVTPTATRSGYRLGEKNNKIKEIDVMFVGGVKVVAGRVEARQARTRLAEIGRGGHGEVMFIENWEDISWSPEFEERLVRLSIDRSYAPSQGWQLSCDRCASGDVVDALRALGVAPSPRITLEKK